MTETTSQSGDHSTTRFWLAVTFVIIWVLLIVIWAVTGQGYFWPIWAIIGMGIALAFMGFDAYRSPTSDHPTDAQITDEMKRLGGS